ncbi:hypothetical protein, partial [Peribacillus simplex]|uniref:hypothetical protein n=1 Tax=Peribacillus simplex TaxID=1478 RepID=UPI000BD31B1F
QSTLNSFVLKTTIFTKRAIKKRSTPFPSTVLQAKANGCVSQLASDFGRSAANFFNLSKQTKTALCRLFLLRITDCQY